MSVDVSGKRILVTGAGGFIGSHLCDELVRRGALVTAFCRYNSRGDRGMLEADCEVVFGDIADAARFASIGDLGHTVFHCAALIGIPYSYHAAQDYVRVNIEGTRVVLEDSLEGCERVVHVSSSEVYGSAQYTPMDEAHPLSAQSPYAATKIAADMLALSYHRSFGLPVTVVRPFNTYGPRQSERAIVPTIITQALAGDAIRLGNTSAVRDMTYVSDTVAGLIDVGLHPDSIGEVVNLGTGVGRTVWDMACEVMDANGRAADIEHDEQRMRPEASEVDKLISDNSKARALGWAPRVSFAEGVAETVEWFKAHGGADTGRRGYVV